jgi:hypothetical protein
LADLYDHYRALHFRTEAERLRSAAEDLQSIVIRGLVLRLADDYDALAAGAVDDDGRFAHSNDDHE